MGIREGLLALLANGPKHGYQLKVDFDAATGEAWSLNVGQVYTTLQRLERDGLVDAGPADDEGRISYNLTAAGREDLRTWFETPVNRSVANRDEVSIKLLVSIAAGIADPQGIIDRQRRATMTELQDLTGLRGDTPATDFAWQLHLDRLSLQAEAELRWLDRVEQRLATAAPQSPLQPTPGPPVATVPQEGSR
ncbi:MAG: PadR family transcriptional regulator [Acidimicrobiia bacterium]|nr:PadR family transcriptional regulator [Acidimicrobiia bacterium]